MAAARYHRTTAYLPHEPDGASTYMFILAHLPLTPLSNMAAVLRLNKLPQTLSPFSSAIFLWHSHRLRHGAAAMARFTTWRWETVCINNTKWPPYATIVPRHTQAGRSLNLQAHVHTCTPSSHTFIRLRKTLQHGAPYLPIFLYHLIIPPFMGIALGGRDEAHPLLLLRKDSVTFATSVRLRTRNSSVPNPRISMKFNIWFFSNITAKYQVSVEFGKNNRYFTWRPI